MAGSMNLRWIDTVPNALDVGHQIGNRKPVAPNDIIINNTIIPIHNKIVVVLVNVIDILLHDHQSSMNRTSSKLEK